MPRPDTPPGRCPAVSRFSEGACRVSGGCDHPFMTVRPVSESWQRIEMWLAVHAPRTFASLSQPASADAISAAADELGMRFPADLVESLLRHDGVARGDGGFAFPGGEVLMSLEGLLERGRMYKQLWGRDHEIIESGYWNPEFLMFAERNVTPDGLALDCRSGATFGALGWHFKGEGTSFGQWASLAAFLHELAECLEHGHAMGWPRKCVPVAWQGALLWEEAPEPPSALRSVFELAAAASAPAVPEPEYGHVPPIVEDGWAGGYHAFCLTFVHGVDEAELLRRFGALHETWRPRSRAEARDDAARWTSGYLPVVRAGSCGQWAFGIEEGVGEGARGEVLRRLSHGSQAVSVAFSGFTRLSFYEDGQLVTVYDTRRAYQLPGEADPFGVFPALPAHDAAAGRLLPDGRAVWSFSEQEPARQRSALQQVCEVVRDHFGIGLPSEALSGDLTSAHVLPLLPAPHGRTRPPAEVAEYITTAPEAYLRPTLGAQLASAAADNGLDIYPEILEAVHRAERDEEHGIDQTSPLGVRLRLILAEAGAVRRCPRDDNGQPLLGGHDIFAWQQRANTARAFIEALSLPLREAIGVVVHERRDPRWREQLVAQLTGK
ncbi:hypothetical protein C5746_35250 [Streptomyces atratus]|uniref:Knr4/Smi1-like domain-containing protein n=1 Tax=Streptomyces atratus TaxID=1893 RepID=A0A2Z5JLM1_STRAR|nr:hypothetical protein C5746_35250 [Streptomyces atratus]